MTKKNRATAEFGFKACEEVKEPPQTEQQQPELKKTQSQRARTIQVPKDIRDQLKREIAQTLKAKEENKPGQQRTSSSTLKVSDFTVKNYRTQKSIGLTRQRSADLFEFDSKGLVVLKEQVQEGIL